MTLTPVATATVTAKHADWMKVLRLAKLTIPAGSRFYRLPVLSQLYLAPAGESTLAAVFDLETSVQLLLPTAVCSGPMLLPAAELWPVMRELARDRGGPARAAWEPVTVSAPNGQHVRVRGLGRDVNVPWDEAAAVTDYPKLPTVHGPALARVDVPALQSAWKFTAAAAGKDSIALPALTGVRMEFDSRPLITLAATDSKRLAVAELGVERLPARDEAQLLVPAVLGRHLQHLVDDVTIRVANDTVIFTDDPALVKPANGLGVTTSITARLLEAQFPAYRSLIPDVTVHRWKLPRKELIADVRVAAAARKHNEPVPVTFASKHVQVEGGPQRPVTAKTSGTVRSAFNPQFLLDVLTGFTGTHVICRAMTAAKPFLFEGSLEPNDLTGQHLLMPIRLPG